MRITAITTSRPWRPSSRSVRWSIITIIEATGMGMGIGTGMDPDIDTGMFPGIDTGTSITVVTAIARAVITNRASITANTGKRR